MAFFLQNDYKPVTALFDSDGNQIFETVGILRLSAGASNQFAEHTLENGVVVADNKVRLQVRVSIQVILNPEDFEDVYKKLKEADKNSLNFTVQTRVDTYDNMYIESYPYDESSKILGTIALNINFIEQIFKGAKVGTLPPEKVKKPQDTDTVDNGSRLSKPVDDGTVLQRLFGS